MTDSSDKREVEDEAFLRTLIDLTWMRAKESQEVPSSGIQTRLIERTRKAQSSAQPAPNPSEPVWRGEAALRWDNTSDRDMKPLCVGALYVGAVYLAWNPNTKTVMWLARIGTAGDDVGWRDTEQEAKDLLVDHVVKLILGDTA